MIDEHDVLAAISFKSATGFSEFCSALNDCPERGDREGWRELFSLLNKCERNGFVIIERDGRNIESLQLTDAGAARFREGRHIRPLKPGESWRP